MLPSTSSPQFCQQMNQTFNFLLSEATCIWEERSGRPIPPQQELKHQRAWDEALVDHAFDTILETTIDTSSRAHLLAVSTKESGAWLDVLPAPPTLAQSLIMIPFASLLDFAWEQILWLNTPAFVVIPLTHLATMDAVADEVVVGSPDTKRRMRQFAEPLLLVASQDSQPSWSRLESAGRMYNYNYYAIIIMFITRSP